MKKPLPWIPLWVDPWLFGSTRLELSLEERAIWIDLLALAGKDQGHIRANESVPYPIEQLAGLLQVPVDKLEHAIARCLETGKLQKTEMGTLYVANWQTYKLTPRYRRMLSPTNDSEKREDENEKVDVNKNVNVKEKEKKRLPQKGNTLPKNGKYTELPPIPKHLPFSIIEQFHNRLNQIKSYSRYIENPETDDDSREKFKAKREKLVEEYLEAIAEYT